MKTVMFISAFVGLSFLATSQAQFEHILITNDDGIEDADKLLALARSVKKVAKRVSIVVSNFDRSGTSNHTMYGKYHSVFEVECEYLDEENSISAYTTPGNPADCIVLGLGGLFGDDVPDLVLSGINGGSNIGPQWFGSGTIGAARTAAFFHTPAIALSGFEDDYENSFTVIPEWITALISSGIVDKIEPGSYLTVGFPKIRPEEIKGVKIAPRRTSYDLPQMLGLQKIHGEDPHEEDNKTVWTIAAKGNPVNTAIEKDDTFLGEGFIVITPMSIDENDQQLFEALTPMAKEIPAFKVD